MLLLRSITKEMHSRLMLACNDFTPRKHSLSRKDLIFQGKNLSDASLGTTMMRVTMKYNAAATPCETFSYGEVEDYAVNITGQTYGFAGFGNNHMPGEQIGNEESTQVVLYPVPVKESNTLNVAVTNGSKNSLISIYNIHGVLVKQTRINGSKVKINVSGLPQGNYILKMDDPKEPFIKGFIKEFLYIFSRRKGSKLSCPFFLLGLFFSLPTLCSLTPSPN